MKTKPDPDRETEAAFLRRLAKQLGVAELSEEALAKVLGFDAFTDEKLDRWFVTTMRRWLEDPGGPPPATEQVVQVDPHREEPQTKHPALAAAPAARKKRRGRP